jgi:hypothetical protein
MLKLIPAAAALAVFALPAAAKPANTGPTPLEQVGMHVGDTATNGSATIVTDRNGTHPEGFDGQLPVNPISASNGVKRHHHHRDHRVAGG